MDSLFDAANTLLGTAEDTAVLPSPIRQRDSLSTILQRRLARFYALAATLQLSEQQQLPERVHEQSLQSETELKRLTAQSASFLLNLIHYQAKASLPSTSKQVNIPLFGTRDRKTVATLAGLVGRWSISHSIINGILPSTFKDGTVKSSDRITEIIDPNPSFRACELNLVVKETLQLVLLQPHESRHSGTSQLAALILPQLLLPLLAALVQLGYSHHATGESARDNLAQLLALYASQPPMILPALN